MQDQKQQQKNANLSMQIQITVSSRKMEFQMNKMFDAGVFFFLSFCLFPNDNI